MAHDEEGVEIVGVTYAIIEGVCVNVIVEVGENDLTYSNMMHHLTKNMSKPLTSPPVKCKR